MIRLSREIRFALVPVRQLTEHEPLNSWAGWPSTNSVAPHLVLRCEIEGEVDQSTGYLCNIKVVDELLRSIVTRRLIPKFDGSQSAESMIRTVFRELVAQWEHATNIVAVSLALSPFQSYSIVCEDDMHPSAIQLTQQFEFSAAHRLHCNELSDEENRELFGKCNNPNGHGHNYVVEVTISREIDSDRGQVIAMHEFESTVKRLIVDRLDHQHLNEDVEHFKNLNPSVENIGIAIYQWLEGQFGSAELEKIKVFETPKTWAEYSGA